VNEQEDLKNRVEDQINLLNTKNAFSKQKYQICQVVVLVLVALVTVSGILKAAEFP
jgi:hypothetical protein|tara:strand:- start:504 stop:671 length:168 start_codon:yes stop_codon:yes gene_type:complete